MSYVPGWMRNLSLGLDVPPFFFITGAILGQKKFKAQFFLTQAFKLSMLFAGTVALAQVLFLKPDITAISQALFLKDANIPQFPVFRGSYWFVPIYVKSLLLSIVLLKFLPRLIFLYILSGIVYICVLTFSSDIKSGEFLGSDVRSVIFYSLFILLGYTLYDKKIKTFWKILLMLSCLISGFTWLSIPNFSMQSYKFPPSIIYFVYSLISISLFMIFKSSFNSPLTRWMGKNALYLYMSQGISSSLIYGLVQNLHLGFWPLKLALVFTVNLGLSLAIGWSLSRCFSLLVSCPLISFWRGNPGRDAPAPWRQSDTQPQ